MRPKPLAEIDAAEESTRKAKMCIEAEQVSCPTLTKQAIEAIKLDELVIS